MFGDIGSARDEIRANRGEMHNGRIGDGKGRQKDVV